MTRRFLSIGECMVEMAMTGDGLYRQGFAGDTFNTAWYARRALGPDWQVSYFTTAGDETLSQRMLAFMEEQQVSTRYIRQLRNRTPGLYLISLSSGERSFSYWRDASAAKALADDEASLAAAMADSDAIYFSGITLAILDAEARQRLLRQLAAARAQGKLIAFDSNIRLRLWPDMAELRAAIGAAARVTTVALPTVPDEPDVFGEAGHAGVARRYREEGVTELVVKAGAGDALAVWPGGETHVPPERNIIPVDTTGAGDSFNGAYLAARLQGIAPPEAARRAHVTAARVIQAHGALVP